MLIVFGLVMPWLLIGVGCWLFHQLVRQNGRMLLRLESLEARLSQVGTNPTPTPAEEPVRGLAVGTDAPGFELADLSGRKRSLAQFRGRHVLLVFFNPGCGFCTQMLPQLAALPPDGGKGRPAPVIVTTGDARENRKQFRKFHVACPVLLQKAMEVASLYQAHGTPTGYLVDEKGRIGSPLAIGAEALLSLADGKVVEPAEQGACGESEPAKAGKNGAAKHHGGNRPLSTSRLNRSGLSAGAVAPTFRLPRVDGGELALEDYHGRNVLLIFSDPQCGPCDALAPKLQALHRHEPNLQILMISRREIEDNRRKVTEYGLTFPVAVQKNWDTSMLYGMFATPIAYWIDAGGKIGAEAGVGEDAILELAKAAAGAGADSTALAGRK
jgi:peroxiredoxin